MNPRLAKRNRERVDSFLRKANKSPRKPWSAPVTIEMAVADEINGNPRIWLQRAIDLMAFGGARIPKNPFKQADQRIRASRALCNAARTELLTIYGSPNDRTANAEKIPSLYFDTPCCLGAEDNTLGPDFDLISKNDHPTAQVHYNAARDPRKEIWFNVRIETKSFFSWLLPHENGIIQSNTSTPPTNKPTPKMQASILIAADEIWHGGKGPPSNKERNRQIREYLKSNCSDKTIQRAFASRAAAKSGQ